MLYVSTSPSRYPPLKNLDINRILHPAQLLSSPEDSANLPEPRILILVVSPDASNSYIPIMNSIFSAQKLVSSVLFLLFSIFPTFIQKITIDVCKIFGPDSVFLQQAAYLTGGSYIYLEHREALLQYLIVRSLPELVSTQLTHVFQMSFLPTPSIRKIITVPTEDKTDFRAACFCHKHIVDVGYVCSVCLSSLVHLTTLPEHLGSFFSSSLLPACACLFDMPVSSPAHLFHRHSLKRETDAARSSL